MADEGERLFLLAQVSFCRKVGLPVLGVVENMAGLALSLQQCSFAATRPLSTDAVRACGLDARAVRPARVPASAPTVRGWYASASSRARCCPCVQASSHAGTATSEEDVTDAVRALLAERFPGLLVSLRADVFRAGGGTARMCADMGLDILARVPLDPGLGEVADAGRSALAAAQEAVPKGPLPAACVPALRALVDAVVARTGAAPPAP